MTIPLNLLSPDLQHVLCKASYLHSIVILYSTKTNFYFLYSSGYEAIQWKIDNLSVARLLKKTNLPTQNKPPTADKH